jgi:iron complex outermembrane receptor protein
MNTNQKIKTSRLLTTSILVGFSALLLSGQTKLAEAADSGSQASKGEALEEIVVTARKTAEDVQRVPIAVTAVSGDELKQQSITTIANLQSLVPGLYIQQAIGENQSLIVTLRGRKQDDATLSSDPAVGILVDGFYYPRTNGLAGAMLDIDRVEVLRGPQGTLYGRNTTGGAMGIFTKDPTDEWSGSIDLTGGNFGTFDVVGIANIPITHNLDARFVAQLNANGPYATTATGDRLNDTRSEYFRGKLRWSGANNWQAVLSGHYEDDHSGGYRAFVPGLNPANFQGNGLPVGSFLALETEADLGVSEAQAVNLLKSWTAQRSPWYTIGNTYEKPGTTVRRSDGGLTISGDLSETVQFRSLTGVEHFTEDSVGAQSSPIFIFSTDIHFGDTYYSQEFQILGKTPTLNWVVGAYGGLEEGRDAQALFFAPAVFGTVQSAHDDLIHYTTLAAFAQATWEFVPEWHLTGGIRESRDRRSVNADVFNADLANAAVHDCIIPAPGALVANPSDPTTVQCPREFKISSSKPTWLVSLDHQLTTDVLLYAKVATGYRSGGSNARDGATEIESYASFAPETNVEYETGAKTTFFDHRVRLNVAGYWDQYSNLQQRSDVLSSDNTVTTPVTSVSKARIRGVEVESDIIVGGGLRLHVSTAYTDARYLKFEDASGDHSHQPFAIPKWTAAISGNYTRPTSIGDASLEVDYDWKSAVNVAPTTSFVNEVTQSAYGLLDARANLHVAAWDADVALFGRNLTNKEYFDQGFNLAFSGFVDFNDLFLGGTPRTWGVEFVKKFGESK